MHRRSCDANANASASANVNGDDDADPKNFPGQHYFQIVQIHLDEHQLAIGLDVRRPSQAKPSQPSQPNQAKPSNQTTQQPIDQPAK